MFEDDDELDAPESAPERRAFLLAFLFMVCLVLAAVFSAGYLVGRHNRLTNHAEEPTP